VDDDRHVSGVITRKHLRALTQSEDPETSLGQIVRDPVVAHPDEPLRAVVFRMAETGLTRMPVIEADSGRLVGMVSLEDLLFARVRNLNEERHRQRVLELRFPFRSRSQTVGKMA
jgi:CBS domain-containing protein